MHDNLQLNLFYKKIYFVQLPVKSWICSAAILTKMIYLIRINLFNANKFYHINSNKLYVDQTKRFLLAYLLYKYTASSSQFTFVVSVELSPNGWVDASWSARENSVSLQYLVRDIPSSCDPSEVLGSISSHLETRNHYPLLHITHISVPH